MTWPPTPRADGLPCKHCGHPITGDAYPVHAGGNNRGKQRCDPTDSGLIYGYNADPEGAPCNEICLGSTTA
jgi:hypothetical protein